MKIRAKFCLAAITEIPFYPGYPSRHEFMFVLLTKWSLTVMSCPSKIMVLGGNQAQ